MQKQQQSMIGPLFVSIGYALILCIAVVHFRVLLPLATADQALSPLISAFHRCASVFLLVELLAQYSLAVWSDPGYVRSLYMMKSRAARHDNNDNISTGYDDTPSGFCKKCAREKPRRAHHCRVCATCVHEMDHHCPWINNCVGYNNYRFFWLLLLYLWVCCLYVALLSFEPFAKVLQAQKIRKSLEIKPELALEDRVKNVVILFSFLLTSTLGVVLFGYWVWHFYLVLTQQTTIEFASRSSGRRGASDQQHRAVHSPAPPHERRHHHKYKQLVRSLQRLLRRNGRLWVVAFVLPPVGVVHPSAKAKHEDDDDAIRWRV